MAGDRRGERDEEYSDDAYEYDGRSYSEDGGEEDGERQEQRQPELPPREPVSREDVEQYAAYLGIDIEAEPHLLALAHEALTAPLPDGWEEVDDGEHVFFHRASEKHSQYEHPLEDQFRQIIAAYRESAERHRPRCCAAPDDGARAPALPLAAAGAARTYQLEPAGADGLLVHLLDAPPAAEPAGAPAGAAGSGSARAAASAAAFLASAPSTTAPPPVLACSVERARLARARRALAGKRRRLPAPVRVSRESLCSGSLRCEFDLLQVAARVGCARCVRLQSGAAQCDGGQGTESGRDSTWHAAACHARACLLSRPPSALPAPPPTPLACTGHVRAVGPRAAEPHGRDPPEGQGSARQAKAGGDSGD